MSNPNKKNTEDEDSDESWFEFDGKNAIPNTPHDQSAIDGSWFEFDGENADPIASAKQSTTDALKGTIAPKITENEEDKSEQENVVLNEDNLATALAKIPMSMKFSVASAHAESLLWESALQSQDVLYKALERIEVAGKELAKTFDHLAKAYVPEIAALQHPDPKLSPEEQRRKTIGYGKYMYAMRKILNLPYVKGVDGNGFDYPFIARMIKKSKRVEKIVRTYREVQTDICFFLRTNANFPLRERLEKISNFIEDGFKRFIEPIK